MSKEELIFKVLGTGCKMLDDIDVKKLSINDICIHLKKSCCPALKDIIKDFQQKKIIS
jgi:hypothetical protein